jgi:transposase
VVSMILASLFEKFTPHFKVSDLDINPDDETIIVELKKDSESSFCFKCGEELTYKRGRHRLKLESLSILGYRTFFYLWREKRHCPCCKKARSESIEFISDETPHMTREFSFLSGKLCEISTVAKAAKHLGLDSYSAWRADFRRMNNMKKSYQIPKVTHLSVDEVYVRKKSKFKGESRNKRFFTIVSDLKKRKVLWTSEGRSKESLDEFFKVIGKKECRKIQVVAGDQFEGFYSSVKENCPDADFVFDRFHIMQNFNKAFNDQRKAIYKKINKDKSFDPEIKKFCSGKYKYVFLKRESRRTKEESDQMELVLNSNQDFVRMEIIKEKMKVFFDCEDEDEAFQELAEIRTWCHEMDFNNLLKWHMNLIEVWDTLKNYFKHRVTSALSEGMNNVIKATIRRGYGYRNMDYLKLKIMQQCGYLNSDYFKEDGTFLI